MKYFHFILVVCLFLISCDDGELKPKSAPDTSIFIESIELKGEDRLTSVVQLYWLGTDKDGYVKGYDISFDEMIWSRVTRTDSLFKFSISNGSDTSDITFYVRSIDNDGLIDLSPASLKIPIKNTAPSIQLEEEFQPQDTTNTVFSLVWNALDLDGETTIDSTFLKINDGPWFSIDGQKNAARFIPSDPKSTGPIDCRVLSSQTQNPTYVINNEREETKLIKGLILNDINVIYIQTRDNAGSFSEIDTSSTFYLKSQTSDFLISSAHFDQSIRNTYSTIFNDINQPYDYIDLVENNAKTDIRFWNFNFPLILDLYESVFWYSANEFFSSGTPLLEIAINNLQPFLDGGGKLLLSTLLTGDADQTSPLFNFAPIDSISAKDGLKQARYVNGSAARPLLNGYDSILCTANIANAAPFHNSLGSEAIYKAEPLKLNGWDGPEVIGARVKNGNGNTNFIFFSVELHKFNGKPEGLKTFFNKALNEEFNW